MNDNKPTTAQRAFLKDAVERNAGRIRNASVTTIDIMGQRGWIEKDSRTREMAERSEIAARRDRSVVKAASLITSDWRGALIALNQAQDEQSDLDRQCYWITKSGRKAAGLDWEAMARSEGEVMDQR